MKKSYVAAALLGAAGLLAGGQAWATSIVLPLNQFVQSGGAAYSGQFDISSYLGSGPSGFEVVGARVIATGFSPQDDHFTVGSYGPPQQVGSETYVVTPAHFVTVQACDFFCPPTQVFVPEVTAVHDTYLVQREVSHTDFVADGLLLDVGEATGTGSATTHFVNVTPFSPEGTLFETGTFQTGIRTTLGETRVVTDWRYGPLSAFADLTQNDLANLNLGGLLDFSVGATAGRFTLSNVELQFDLRALDGSGVPEPDSWVMMIVGFAGLGLALRRRGRRAIAFS